MDRERLTITLRKDLLQKVDATVDGSKIRNRSHAIEYLIANAFPATIRKAVILASGKGVKMRPLTYELPKPMIPVSSRPILEHIIELLRNNTIRDILIVTGPLGDKIKAYFGDGSKFGVHITYIHEEEPSGTAIPLKKATSFLGEEPFLLLYGDVLADINLKEMIDYHENNSHACITMALTTASDAGEWGVVGMRGNKVVSFEEKPGLEEGSKLISAGIFIIDPEVIENIPDLSFSMLEKDVLPKLVSQEKVIGYAFDGQWFDIATPEIYEKALKNWKQK